MKQKHSLMLEWKSCGRGCNPNAATIVGVDMWEAVVTPNYPNISLIFMNPRLQENARILKFLLSFLLTGVSI